MDVRFFLTVYIVSLEQKLIYLFSLSSLDISCSLLAVHSKAILCSYVTLRCVSVTNYMYYQTVQHNLK
jgi:hypothetical protein